MLMEKRKEKVMGLENTTVHMEDEKEAGEGREASYISDSQLGRGKIRISWGCSTV